MALVLWRTAGETVTVGEGDTAVDVTVLEAKPAGFNEHSGRKEGATVRLAFEGRDYPDGSEVPVFRREVAADRAIRAALAVALKVDDSYDGDHLMWVIDQMVRVLAGPRYDEVIPEGWDSGVAP
jgi:hypothetical protein